MPEIRNELFDEAGFVEQAIQRPEGDEALFGRFDDPQEFSGGDEVGHSDIGYRNRRRGGVRESRRRARGRQFLPVISRSTGRRE